MASSPSRDRASSIASRSSTRKARRRRSVRLTLHPSPARALRRPETRPQRSRKGSNYYADPSVGPTLEAVGSEVTTSTSLPVGGRLKQFWREWQQVGAPKRIVSWLRQGYPLAFRLNNQGLPITPPLFTNPLPHLVSHYADPVKQAALDTMIDELIQKRAARLIDHDVPVHFSSAFLVPKKNGKLRLVINLRPLNEFLACPTFQMDHSAVIREALMPGMWATSVDLADAYLHVPVRESDWRFLVIQVGDRRVQFMVLPFGLNAAPRVFSDIMKVLKKWARRIGLLLFQYLDDWLQLHLQQARLAHQVQLLLAQCRRLGLLINLPKSDLVPSQRLCFLGDDLDFARGRVRPTQARFQDICSKVQRVTRHESARFLHLHSLLGLLVATEKIVPYGRVHLRCYQLFIAWHLRHRVKRRQRVFVPNAALLDLLWWTCRRNVMAGIPMAPQPPRFQIQTDASTSGWGVLFQGSVMHGQWSPSQSLQHINCLEMMTVIIACERLLSFLRGSTVLFLVDNQTVVSYIQKQGGTRSQKLMHLAERLWLLAEENLILLQARHIKGSHNVVADLASRTGCVVNTEWSFPPRVFNRLMAESPFGPPQIDLFANKLNHRLPLYFSPCPDQRAMAIDALLTQWPRHIPVYAFPPTTIMDRVLTKIAAERPAALCLIAPRLLEATWFPRLQLLPIVKSVPADLAPGDLVQPHWRHAHANPSLFNLFLWFISFQD